MKEGATLEQQIAILLEMKDFQQKMDAINDMFTKSIKNAETLGQVVDAISSKMDNLAKVASQAKNVTNNVTKNITNSTTNLPNQPHSVAGSHGAMGSASGREQAFKDYQKAVIDTEVAAKEEVQARTKLTNEIKRDTAERRKLRQQNADAATKSSEAALLRAQKAEDKTSAEFLAYRAAETDKMNRSKNFYDYRDKHPELFAAGGQNWSVRYNTAKGLSAVGNTVSSFGPQGKAIGLVFDSLGAFFKSPVAGTAAAISNLAKGVLELGKNAVQAFSEIESIKTQLGVVFSNQSQADSMFGEISQYAVKSPFGVQQTSELAVLLKQSGVYASDLMDTLKMLGDTAGGNMEKMKRIANNYAQIVSIGKASMLDMRQFAYAGIPIFEAVSKELGVSQQELRKLISDGKVTSDIIEKVFKDLTGINGMFENATEKGAKTLKARLQNLSDARQLALSEAGELIVNLGTKTGNDSYVNEIVGGLEHIYQWLDTNLEKHNKGKTESVDQEFEDRTKAIKQLIATASSEEEKLLFEKRLKALEDEYDEERAEANYVAAYDLKAQDHNEFLKSQGLDFYASETAQMALSKFVSQYEREISLGNILENRFGGDAEDKSNLRAYESQYIKTHRFATKDTADEYIMSIYTEYQRLKKILDDAKSAELVNGKERDSAVRRDVREEQAKLADNINSINKSSSSVANTFAEIRELQKQQKSYQEKEKELKTQEIKNGVDFLKELKGVTTDAGELKYKDISFDDYLKYVNSGAFSVDGLYNVVSSKENKEALEVEKYDLRDNYVKALSEVKDKLNLRKADENIYFGNSKGLKELEGLIETLNQADFHERYFDISDTNMFYKRFTYGFNLLIKRIGKVINNVDTEEEKQFYTNLKKYIGGSTLRLGTDLTGYDYVEEDNGKPGKPEDIGIPLWKRILSQYTGLTTQGMTDKYQTMENYRDDMAIRNMASDVLKATMRSMDFNTAMDLMRTSGGAKILKDSTNTVYQVDWEETKNAMHDFATSLRATSDVIGAYKSGLEAQLAVYEEIAAAGLTEGESQDLKSQKTISAKKLASLSTDAGDQLVNAFGEDLVTADGLKVSFDGTNFIDEKGNVLQEEQIRITDKLFEFIKGELPNLRKELREVTAGEMRSKLFEDSINNIKHDIIMKLTNSSMMYTTSGFMESNPDFVNALFSDALKEVKAKHENDEKYEHVIGLSETNLLSRTMLRQTGEEHYQNESYSLAEEIVQEAAEIVRSEAAVLAKDTAYQHTAEVDIEKDSASRNRLRELQNAQLVGYDANSLGLNTNSSDAAVKKAKEARLNEKLQILGLGVDRKYNMNSLYEDAKAAGFDGKYRGKRVDIAPGKEGELSSAEKGAIRWAQSLADIRDIVEELGDDFSKIGSDFLKNGLVDGTKKLGYNLAKGKDAVDGMSNVYKNLTAELLDASGQAMVKAGWELVAMGAADHNWAMIAGGLALAGAGGFVSGVGGALKEDETEKAEDKAKKLEDLKKDLADLLKQAREDALYYESTLSHKKALSANEEFTARSVNDAVITPRGDVITTDPKDYLIATKTPKTLVGGGSPTINFSVIDKSTGIKVTQQRATYNEDTNSVDFEAVIESKVTELISSAKTDDAFAAREARLSGRHVVA